MILAQYNHFIPATKKIAEGEASLDAYLVLNDGDAIPSDYTDKSEDILVIEAACKSGIIDYLSAKIRFKETYDNLTGATEQDRFDSIATNDEKYILISFSLVDPNIAVPFLMGYLTQDAATAQGTLLMLGTKSKKENALACKARLEATEQWEPIILQHFSQATALDIKQDCRNYLQDYGEDALFGVGYFNDSILGILNFVLNTGAIALSLEDYTLLGGATDYAPVQAGLTKHFYA